MPSLDEMFYREFNQMLSQRKAQLGVVNLYDLALPESVANSTIDTHDKVYISGIDDEYYSKLNGTEAILLSRPNLKRRKFDYKGEFIKKDGNYVFEEVDVHNKCVAVVSNTKLGVPLKYKPKEDFTYVDIIDKEKEDGSRDIRYIYIVPKKYCYKLNQVALVLSLNKMRVYYSGIGMALQSGTVVYLYTIPYKPSKSERSYRCLGTKTELDFSQELTDIRDFWLKNNMLFDYASCELPEGVRGRSNVAYEEFPQVLESYIRYNPEKSLADVKDEVNDIM